MPRPPLPDDLRKDTAIKVRFLESEMPILVNQAKLHNCKNISAYVRKLIKEDIVRSKKIKSLPPIW